MGRIFKNYAQPLWNSMQISRKFWPQVFLEWDQLVLPDFAWFNYNVCRWPYILMVDVKSQHHWKALCQILENYDLWSMNYESAQKKAQCKKPWTINWWCFFFWMVLRTHLRKLCSLKLYQRVVNTKKCLHFRFKTTSIKRYPGGEFWHEHWLGG